MTKKDVDRNRKNSLRLRNFDYSTRRTYFVTVVTHHRKKIFYDSRLARAICGCLVDLRGEIGFRLYCYCLMPDHLHALIGVGDANSSLGQILGAFKSVSTRIYWQSYQGLLWQRQFFDHVRAFRCGRVHQAQSGKKRSGPRLARLAVYRYGR